MKTQCNGEPRASHHKPAYLRQVKAFRRKFGREMGPQDPFFFDPRADTPQFRPPEDAKVALDVLVELMVEAGLDAEVLYAAKRTGGLFPTPASGLSPDQQQEWDAAVSEYRIRLLKTRKQ